MASMIDGHGLDDTADGIAIGQRFGERFEDDGAYTLTGHVAIAPGPKGLAAALGRPELRGREGQVLGRV